jgi:hypothetical protein
MVDTVSSQRRVVGGGDALVGTYARALEREREREGVVGGKGSASEVRRGCTPLTGLPFSIRDVARTTLIARDV